MVAARRINRRPLIGFVGRGVVGDSYAEDFKRRGYPTISYALEEPYRANKHRIKNAEVVFVCVATPTTPEGFDSSSVKEALKLVGKGKIAVIKSTVLPGTTRRLQQTFPQITILCSPELLSSSNAAHDAASPFSNIIGLPLADAEHQSAAELVRAILPKAAFDHTCTSEEAELYKYAHNVSGYLQVLAYNLIYDVALHTGADWNAVEAALQADPMLSKWYIRPVDKGGRGAGGPCFLKDFAAFTHFYAAIMVRHESIAFLHAAAAANVALLKETNKDVAIVEKVYGSP